MAIETLPQQEYERARQTVEQFVGRFKPYERAYWLLACHAALPLVLTPELLNYLRNKFLHGLVPWVAEADLLLSDLCSPAGYELYTMDTAVRAYLLSEMHQDSKLGPERMQEVARLLIHYVRHLARTNPFVGKHELQAQQWGAMVYLDEHRDDAVRQIAESFQNCVSPKTSGQPGRSIVDRTEMTRLARITQALAPELEKYAELITYAGNVSRLLVDPMGNTAQELYRNRQLDQVTRILDVDLPALGVLVRQDKPGRVRRARVPRTLLDVLDAEQQRGVANVRAAAGLIWSRPLHRYYTDHTTTHSERVIALLNGLTAGMMAMDKRLAPDEVFVLLAAAYLYDIGMQDERYANGDIEIIHTDHHEVTAELIYRAAQDSAQAVRLGLPEDPGLVEAVAQVAKGHRKVDLGAAEYKPLVHGGVTIRLRLLAALLRFGDELDIDHRRVDLDMMKLMNLPLDSQLRWWRCHYVSGVSIEDEYIKIAYRFPQDRPDYESFIVPLVEGDIRKKLIELEEIFRANAIKVAIAKSQVRLMRLVQVMPGEVEEWARGQGNRGIVVHELVTAAVSDAELNRLCYDYFQPVFKQFSVGMSRTDKIQRLIEYCEWWEQWDVLLKQVEKCNPNKYQEFAARLHLTPPPAPPRSQDLLDELFEQVRSAESTMSGDAQQGSGSIALQALRETRLAFGNPTDKLICLTAELFETAGVELEEIYKRQMREQFDFYYMPLTVLAQPKRGTQFAQLECSWDFGPKGAGKPIVQTLFPSSEWREVISWGGSIDLALNGKLEWVAKLSRPDATRLAHLPSSIQAHIGDKNTKEFITIPDYSFRLGRPDISAAGESSSQCFWRIEKLDLQEAQTVQFGVVFKVPKGTTAIELEGQVAAEADMNWLTASLRNVFDGLSSKLQSMLRGKGRLAIGAQERWSITLPAAQAGSQPPTPEKLYGTGNRWAVLVGIDTYEDALNYGRLRVCVKDVEATREQLIAGGFDTAHIRLLTDNTQELPTRASILAALQSVANATKPDDLLLFYFSGHGDETGSESYLVPRDGLHVVLSDTAVPLVRVKQIMERAPARAKIILLDTCHSGANIGDKGAEPMAEAFIRGVFEEAEGIAVLTSCRQRQLSYEWRESERSVFTHYLLEALRGSADRDGKGFVTVQEASQYVTDSIKRWASQHALPQVPTWQYSVVGDMILARYP